MGLRLTRKQRDTTMTTETTKAATLTGDTFMVRDKLQAGGWSWDADAKCYRKDVDASLSESDVVLRVRALPGVRNRAKKLVVTFA